MTAVTEKVADSFLSMELGAKESVTGTLDALKPVYHAVVKYIDPRNKLID